jgi:O-antigen ligase
MSLIVTQKLTRTVALWSWGFMAFCLPFSTALTLLFSVLGIIFGLLGFDWAAFKRVTAHPISVICLALFFWLALSILWSVAPYPELVEGMSKYRKLLYVPLLAMLLLSTGVRPLFCINFFVAGCLVVSVGSIFSTMGLWDYFIGPQLPQGGWSIGGTAEKHWFYIGPPDFPTFGRAYIAQGAFLVFSAIYLVGVLIQTNLGEFGIKPHRFSLLLFLVVILFFVVASNQGGRTGYLLAIVGMILWALKLWQLKKWTILLRLLLTFSMLCITILTLNPRVTQRAAQVVTDMASYQESRALTGQGIRLRFWESGLRAGWERPLSGWGVGSYAEVYSRDDTQPKNLRDSRPQPHSEYVLQFVQGGLPALMLILTLVWWGILTWYEKSILPLAGSAAGISIIIIYILFLIDGMFNSVIWDLGEGHFFPFLAGALIVSDMKVTRRTGNQ